MESVKGSGHVSKCNPTGELSLERIKMIYSPVHQSSPVIIYRLPHTCKSFDELRLASKLVGLGSFRLLSIRLLRINLSHFTYSTFKLQNILRNTQKYSEILRNTKNRSQSRQLSMITD